MKQKISSILFNIIIFWNFCSKCVTWNKIEIINFQKSMILNKIWWNYLFHYCSFWNDIAAASTWSTQWPRKDVWSKKRHKNIALYGNRGTCAIKLFAFVIWMLPFVLIKILIADRSLKNQLIYLHLPCSTPF